jgi:hypothetical protein
MDTRYSIVGYNERKRLVILEKQVRWGIHFDEIRVTNITRKYSGERTIALEGIKHNLSKIGGL